MKVSDYIVKYLRSQGVEHGFFLNGGMITPIADSCQRLGLKLYTVHHEQAASFAAEAQAAVTKNIGFAMGTSGPGATNMITGIASAFFASYPVLFITGQVNTGEANTNKKRRQAGFQELDIVTLISSITKYARLVNKSEDIPFELEKSVFYAKQGRMGPVLLDIPIDVQQNEISEDKIHHFIGSAEHVNLTKKSEIDNSVLTAIARELKESKRPVILLGHGVKLSGAEVEVRKVIEITGIPFVTSLLGTDIVPNSHTRCFDFIGTYGRRYSNFALANADLILVLGARLDTRQIGVQSKGFAPLAKIIHIDIDEAELGASKKEYISVKDDIREFLIALLPHLDYNTQLKEWINFLEGLKNKYQKREQMVSSDEIDPINAVELISQQYKQGGIITVDVGANQMWFANGWKVKNDQIILTNGGMAPMGYSLPAAIGASLSLQKCEVLVVTGDGGLQINIQEFQTVVRNRLPIKIVVLNNNTLGMITQFQTENFESRFAGTTPDGGYDAPDFAKVAEAYGIHARTVKGSSELVNGINWLLNEKGACLLDIKVPPGYFTLPKSRFIRPVHDMFPLIDRDEFNLATKYANLKKDYMQTVG
ncbi:MAG: thiamine pyrophosphate-binding protein [Thermoplasmatales archaeon]